MKTIFDKVDPKYLECTAGTCEHVYHVFNGPIILVCGMFIVMLVTSKYLKSR